MTDENGAQSIQPGIIRLDLFSGVIVDITPVSPLVYRAFEASAEERFKDPKPPLIELENAVTPQLDKTDPDYLAELKDVQEKRAYYVTENLRSMALSFPQGKENILKMFADKMRILRASGTVESGLDDWQVCFKYFVVTKSDEWVLLNTHVVTGQPLTQEEIDGASRIFRPKVQGQNRAGLVKNRTPGIEGRTIDRSASA